MRRAAALSMGISRKKRAKRNFLMFGLNLDRRDGSQNSAFGHALWKHRISAGLRLSARRVMKFNGRRRSAGTQSAAEVYEPLSSRSAAEGGVLQLQADSKPSGIRIDRSCKGKSFLFAIRFPFGRDDASRRPRTALRAFPLRRALVRGFTRKTARCSAGRLPSHVFSRSAPNDA